MDIVMLLTNSFETDVRVYKEAAYLVKRAHYVTILCWDRDVDSVLPLTENRDGIQVVRFRMPSVAGTGYRQIGAYMKYIHACRKYLKNNKVDVIHCHDLDGMIAYNLIGMRKIPYVFDMHENYIQGIRIKRTLVKWIVEASIKNSHQSIAVLPVENLRLSDSLGEKIVTLRNYPDSSYLSYNKKTVSSKLRIGYHGTVRSQVPYFHALFEACKGLKNVRVDINGSGIDLPELKEMQKNYENVYVHGKYDGLRDSNRLYQNTDLLFCGYNSKEPNYQGETEVVKFYEAIVTGTPMIMTEGIGMAEKVQKFGFGFNVNPQDSQAIRKVILKILDNQKILDECRDRMLAMAERYKWEQAVKVLDKIYD